MFRGMVSFLFFCMALCSCDFIGRGSGSAKTFRVEYLLPGIDESGNRINDGSSIVTNSEGNKSEYALSETAILHHASRPGYDFVCWKLADNGETVETVSSQNAQNGTVRITAVWRRLKFRISFDSDGGSAIDSIEVYYNQSLLGGGEEAVAVDVRNIRPTKEGYDFDCWKDLLETMPAEDITLKAVWAKIHSVSYCLTSGPSDGYEYSLLFKYDDYSAARERSLSDVVVTTTKSGWGLAGWYDNPEFEGEEITSLGRAIAEKGDVQLYAKWDLMFDFVQEGTLMVANSTGRRQKEIVVPSKVILRDGTEKDVELFSFSWSYELENDVLRKVTICEGIKRLEVLCFYNCHALEEVVIPSSVELISRAAFKNCDSLKKVVIDSYESWENMWFPSPTHGDEARTANPVHITHCLYLKGSPEPISDFKITKRARLREFTFYQFHADYITFASPDMVTTSTPILEDTSLEGCVAKVKIDVDILSKPNNQRAEGIKSIGQPIYIKSSILENKDQTLGKAFVIDGYERQDYSDLAGYVKFVPL